jgi:hypothetical protein
MLDVKKGTNKRNRDDRMTDHVCKEYIREKIVSN